MSYRTWGGVLFLVLSSIALAQTPFPSTNATLTLLPKTDAFTEALTLLRAHYYNPKALEFISDESLESLVDGLHGGAYVRSSAKASPNPFHVPAKWMQLAPQIIYVRLFTFRKPDEGWSSWEKKLAESPGQGIILDLRENQEVASLESVAQIAGYFSPPRTKLFRTSNARDGQVYLQKQPTRLFSGPVIILVNHHTSGLAEVLAAALKAEGALVIGKRTAGQGGVFAEAKLSNGQILGYAIQEVILANGKTLLHHPLLPDLVVDENEDAEKLALAELLEHGPLAVIQEVHGRQKLNEAALVRNENPELGENDATHSAAQAETHLLQDITLLRAMDALRTIQFTRRPAAGNP